MTFAPFVSALTIIIDDVPACFSNTRLRPCPSCSVALSPSLETNTPASSGTGRADVYRSPVSLKRRDVPEASTWVKPAASNRSSSASESRHPVPKSAFSRIRESYTRPKTRGPPAGTTMSRRTNVRLPVPTFTNPT